MMVLAVFIPIMLLTLSLGSAVTNQSVILKIIKANTDEFYVAQSGIERYINRVNNNVNYAGILDYNITQNGTQYSVHVTSQRLGEPPKIKIISQLTNIGYTAEKTFTLSRITP